LRLTLTPGIAARLSARLLKEFGSPDEVFPRAAEALEACNLPAPSAQAIVKKTIVQTRGKGPGEPAQSGRGAHH